MRFLTETFLTIHAFVRFFSSVDALVYYQPRVVTEAFATIEAFKGLFSRVGPTVGGQVRSLVEALVAVGALVGLFPCVNSLMYHKTRVVAESFFTDNTQVRFLSQVNDLTEICAAVEVLLLFAAGNLAFSNVDQLLDDKLVQVLETLLLTVSSTTLEFVGGDFFMLAWQISPALFFLFAALENSLVGPFCWQWVHLHVLPLFFYRSIFLRFCHYSITC